MLSKEIIKNTGCHVQEKNGHVQEKYAFFHNVYDNEVLAFITQKLENIGKFGHFSRNRILSLQS